MTTARGVLAVGTLVVLVLPGGSLAAEERPQDEELGGGGWTLVTDPHLLELAGFEPDAEVYLANDGAFEGPFADYLGVDSVLGADELDSPVSPAAPGALPRGYSTVLADAFHPLRDREFHKNFFLDGIYCESGNRSILVAQLHLPQGAEIDRISMWGSDSCNSALLSLQLWYSCHTSTAPQYFTVADLLSETLSNPTPGWFSRTKAVGRGTVVDNSRCAYYALANFGVGTSGNCECGTDLRLHKARVDFSYPQEGAVAPIGNP